MQIKRLVSCAAAVAALFVTACSSPAPAAPPSQADTAASGGLVASAASVDLGRVPFDVQTVGRFDLVNTGTRAVKLTALPEVKMLEGC
jgi:hypothetical protein